MTFRAALLALLVAPLAVAAQAPSTDWSRIIHLQRCHPDHHPCALRAGLVWDTTNAAPAYPEVMRGVGIAGEVVVAFGVRDDGVVEQDSVTIVRASNRAFAPSLIKAVRSWRFSIEGEGRPTGVLPVELHVIYAIERDCRGDASPQTTGWASSNRLVVMSGCNAWVPRSAIRGPQ